MRILLVCMDDRVITICNLLKKPLQKVMRPVTAKESLSNYERSPTYHYLTGEDDRYESIHFRNFNYFFLCGWEPTTGN